MHPFYFYCKRLYLDYFLQNKRGNNLSLIRLTIRQHHSQLYRTWRNNGQKCRFFPTAAEA